MLLAGALSEPELLHLAERMRMKQEREARKVHRREIVWTRAVVSLP
jgi:hypothetical protein